MNPTTITDSRFASWLHVNGLDRAEHLGNGVFVSMRNDHGGHISIVDGDLFEPRFANIWHIPSHPPYWRVAATIPGSGIRIVVSDPDRDGAIRKLIESMSPNHIQRLTEISRRLSNLSPAQPAPESPPTHPR